MHTKTILFNILLGLLLVWVLTIIPLPQLLQPIRPLWAATLILIWVMFLPYLNQLFVAWLAGLSLDALTSTPLGEHALALLVMAFITSKIICYFRTDKPLHQLLLVAIGLSSYQTIIFITIFFMQHQLMINNLLLPIITSLIIWPFFQNLFFSLNYNYFEKT